MALLITAAAHQSVLNFAHPGGIYAPSGVWCILREYVHTEVEWFESRGGHHSGLRSNCEDVQTAVDGSRSFLRLAQARLDLRFVKYFPNKKAADFVQQLSHVGSSYSLHGLYRASIT